MIDEASVGGGQQHVLWLAGRLDKNKFNVSVACEKEGYLVDELKKHSIPHHPISISNRFSAKGVYQCAMLVRHLDPDILHTHGGTAGFYGRVASVLYRRVKVVHTFHGIHYLHFTNRVKKHLFQFIDFILRFVTDEFICVSQKDLQDGLHAKVLSKNNSLVIYNGIDVEKFHNERPDHNISAASSGEKVIIGTIGRLHVQKGQKYFIQAAAAVLKRCPNIEFEIIGDGELRTELESYRDASGLTNKILFSGSQHDIRFSLSRFAIFVLPSLWEGLPIVLLEAMAARKPIISTNVDGICELLEDGKNAILIPPRDSEALALAIIRLLSDSTLRQSLVENAFRKINSEFSVERMVRQIEKVYEKILR